MSDAVKTYDDEDLVYTYACGYNEFDTITFKAIDYGH